MSATDLSKLSVEALTADFVDIGVAQGRALDRGETAKFNRLFGQETRIINELKGRAGDGRLALMKVYGHCDMQVRLNAAKATLAVAPAAARLELQAIRESNWHPPAGDAGMCLHALKQGIFKPT